jgi:hypothetical protein
MTGIKMPMQYLQSPFACIPARDSLSVAAWAIFVDQSMNPLGPRSIFSLKDEPEGGSQAIRSSVSFSFDLR